MVDYTKRFGPVTASAAAAQDVGAAAIFRQAYGWMCAGLAVSGIVAWYTVSTGLFAKILSGPGMTVCIIAELAMVFLLSARAMKMQPGTAIVAFLAYAALNGLTLSVILLVYDLAVVGKTFFLTAGMFGGLALFGTVTRADLSKMGAIMGMALWGLILLAVVQVFWPMQGLEAVVPVAGIVIFCGLTMWDAQKIRLLSEQAFSEADVTRLGILGALTLYLDFINLFIYLLRFFGSRNRD